MGAYETFKKDLSALCERGKISKTTKKRLSKFVGDDVTFDVCGELLSLFEEALHESSEYGIAAERVIWLVTETANEIGFSRDGAVVCAYIRLTIEANSSDDPTGVFAKLKKHVGEYNQSLQNIKHRLPLF